MTNEVDELENMWLAGYVKVTDQGFALPAYVARQGANAWYAALPALDGDHATTISSFELLEGENILPLPVPTIRVSRGAPWQDVFLWAGRVFSGTPRQLLDALVPYEDQLRELAPLSYFDLAVAAESSMSADLAVRALAFLERKLGGAAGAASFRELVLRPAVLRELQRQYGKIAQVGLPTALRDFVLHEYKPGLFEVEMARGTASAVGGEPAVAELRASIARFSDIAGLPLHATGLDEGKTSLIFSESTTEESSAPLDYPAIRQGQYAKPFPRILLIAADRRAIEIARYLEPPVEVTFDSQSIWRAETSPIEHLRDLSSKKPSRRNAVITVSRTIDLGMPLDEFTLVVWLAGNEALRDDRAVSILDSVRSLKPSTPLLIAPAPPSDSPSSVLGERGYPERLLRQCNAIIDTTLARSPFWAGHPRRSVDRRIADIVATVSVVAALDSKLSDALKSGRGSKQPRALSFVGGQSRFDVERATASELNAAGLSSRLDKAIHTQVGFEMRERSSKRLQNAILVFQPLRPDFERFAEAAVVEALGAGRPWQGRFPAGRDASASVFRTMDHPDLAVLLHPSDLTSQPIMVTAETPYLQTLREAESKGASVVRYTDVESLRALMGRQHEMPLPREMRLPKLHRYPQNRGLATRGVDTRDVVRLPEAQWIELARTHPASELEGKVRRYLAAIDVRDTEPEIALPGQVIWNAAQAGDPLAKKLQDRQVGLKSDRAPSGKRTGDLIAAWAPPADGAQRWVLEDGRLPVEMAALDPNAVPAQRLFFIDGDGAVPAFLLSRLFEVWARALLPSATSWASRFQVSKTFDAFPFPWSLEASPNENGRPAHLRFSARHQAGKQLTKLIGRDARNLAEVMGEHRWNDRALRDAPLMREVDILLLEDFHLSPNASDLDILERLIERNQKGT